MDTLKQCMKVLHTCVCSFLLLIILHSPVAQADTADVVHVHLQPYPDSTGKPASFDNAQPSNIVVDVPIYPKADLIHVHDAPSGIGIREAAGLQAALSEYMVPTTYLKTVAWMSSFMPKCGYELGTTDVTAFEYTSESNSKLHVDITLWDLGDQTLMQYWVTDVVPVSEPQRTGIPLLLLIIVLALLVGEVRRIRRSRG